MSVASDVPFVREFSFDYGAPATLSPRVRRVIARNPGPFTYTGSGTYLVGDGRGAIAIIDPGPDDDRHLEALLAAIGPARVSHILITHTHLDHCGGARRLAERVEAPIFGFGPHPTAPGAGARDERHDAKTLSDALDEGGDLGFHPDITLTDGACIAGDDWTLDVIHTPGHLSNHLCFALREERVVFTGDHIMGWSTTVVAPPDGDMGAYLDSLDILLERPDLRYLPTHGAPIDAPHRFVRAVRAHRHMRDRQIIDQIRSGHARVGDIVPAIYAGLDRRLQPAAALNVLAHLIRLRRIGLVEADGPDCADARWRAAAGT